MAENAMELDVKNLKELIQGFKCGACNRNLRPPIRMCKDGHNFCDICKTGSKCAVCGAAIMEENRNVVLENVASIFHLDISCKNHGAGCDYTTELKRVLPHEEDCSYRSVKCVVPNCYQDLRFNDIEEHMAVQHQDIMTEEWVYHKYKENGAPIVSSSYSEYFIKTWRSSGMRLFATLLTSYGGYKGKEPLWAIWVTAACGKRSANNFKAEIRVSSNILPECSLVYYMPVTPLVKGNLDKRNTCLRLQNEILYKHIK